MTKALNTRNQSIQDGFATNKQNFVDDKVEPESERFTIFDMNEERKEAVS